MQKFVGKENFTNVIEKHGFKIKIAESYVRGRRTRKATRRPLPNSENGLLTSSALISSLPRRCDGAKMDARDMTFTENESRDTVI